MSLLPAAGLALALLAPSSPAAGGEDALFRALGDELKRSMEALELQGLDKPYFVSYRVTDRRDQYVSATFGSTLNRGEWRRRSLAVEVRVGTMALDNTNFLSGSMGFSGGDSSVELPLDDNYTELRRHIWLATDRAYKQAVESLSKKKAALQNKTRTDDTPDFSPEEPRSLTDLRGGKPFDMTQAENLVKELSATFREASSVATSQVSCSAADELTRYVNSEGTRFTRETFLVHLDATAATQASDGFSLGDHMLVFSRSWEDLPQKAELLAGVRQVAKNLKDLKDAPLLDQYNGPVLFEGQAASEIFAQVFAQRLGAKKRPVAESVQGESAAAARENPFIEKIGARVLPTFLSVVDDGTVRQVGDHEVFGDAQVDDEGVPTRPVKLVEGGRLKTLLTSRSPVRGILESSGSFQELGPLPRNVIVTAEEGMEPQKLKDELLRLAKERGRDYAIVIRRMSDPIAAPFHSMAGPSGGDGVRVEPVILAYKVFADGHEELVRNLEIDGMSATLFRDIVAAGRDRTVATLPFRTSEAPAPQVVSFVTPSLLFEDVTLRKPGGEIPKPQVAKHPFFDR